MKTGGTVMACHFYWCVFISDAANKTDTEYIFLVTLNTFGIYNEGISIDIFWSGGTTQRAGTYV